MSAASDALAILPALARAAISAQLGCGERRGRADLSAEVLDPGASFVTVSVAGALRGCVGTLEPRRPLVEDVEANARSAAFADPRFPPLSSFDLPRLTVEVSVLSPLESLPADGCEELLRRLVPRRDGLVLEVDEHRATFLPQVWRSFPEPREFVEQLRIKAGLGPDFWDRRPLFSRYRVRKWVEGPAGESLPGLGPEGRRRG